jgi:hypothetical protein
MKVAGAVDIFGRSESTRHVHYVQYLGDGDSKGFMKVIESEPYGDSVNIEKLECVGYVQKRLGPRLRKLRKDFKGKKLPDDKLLSGRGRLTDAEIEILQSHHGKAIHSNTDSLSNICRLGYLFDVKPTCPTCTRRLLVPTCVYGSYSTGCWPGS